MSRAAIVEVRRDLERLLKERRTGIVAAEEARLRLDILAEIVRTHELEARLQVLSDLRTGRPESELSQAGGVGL